MAYASARDGGYGATASIIHSDSSHPGFIVVPDAHLLFTADFSRAGPDLILTDHDGRHHIVPGYFASEHRPVLSAPNGASLTPDLIDLLAGSPAPGQYAQAQPTTPPDAIGKVEKLVGTVTVMRNGVSVALNVGDAVFKTDVIQTGVNSSVGIDFPDGTALNLVANTRMALNDYSYDANSTSNVALFTLVEGTFAFVAGKVAHTGDMHIGTPVATMGIRGTSGWVQEQLATISVNNGQASFAFAVIDGAYDVIDQQGNVIATVSQAGLVTYITPQGLGLPPLVSTQPMTPAQALFQQEVYQPLLDILNQITAPKSNGNNGSSTPPPENNPSNPQFNEHLNNNGTITYTTDVLFNGPNGPTTTTVSFTTTTTSSSSPASNPNATDTWTSIAGGNFDDPTKWSAGAPPTLTNQGVDVDQTGLTPLTIDDVHFVQNLTVGAGTTVEIVGDTLGSGSLTALGVTDIAGLIDVHSTGIDPLFAANGNDVLANSATIEAGGEVEARGRLAEASFENDVVDNSGTLLATHHGKVLVEDADLTNEDGGRIVAAHRGKVIVEDSTVTNDDGALIESRDRASRIEISGVIDNEGAIKAVRHGTIDLTLDSGSVNAGFIGAFADGTINVGIANGDTSNTGTMEAGRGGAINFFLAGDNGHNNGGGGNFGTIEALAGGTIAFKDGGLNNEDVIEANGRHAEVSFAHTHVDNSDLIVATHRGDVSFDRTTIANENGATIGAEHGGRMSIRDSSITNDAGGAFGAEYHGTLTVDHSHVDNSGEMGANRGGRAIFDHDRIYNDANGADDNDFGASFGGAVTVDHSHVFNDGQMGATECGTLTFDHSRIKNDGQFSATSGATLTFERSFVVNNTGIDITTGAPGFGADDGGTIAFAHSTFVNNGQTAAQDGGSITFTHSTVHNNGAVGPDSTDGIFAENGGSIAFDRSHVDNPGTISAITGDSGGGGEIAIDNTTVDNACGTISAEGDNTLVQLSDATIIGGTLVTGPVLPDPGGDTIAVVAACGANMSTLDGTSSAVTIEGYVGVFAGAQLDLKGTIHIDGDDGRIDVAASNGSSTDPANLLIDGYVTIDGNGGGNQITLDSTACHTAEIIAAPCTSCDTLDNVNDTISGNGQIGLGDGALTLINEACGVIQANDGGSDTGPLILYTGNTITNLGMVETANGSALKIEDSTIDNASGCANTGIVQVVSCSHLVLDDATILAGHVTVFQYGELDTVCGTCNEINTAHGDDNTDTVTLSNAGIIAIADGSELALASPSTICNSGTIDLNATCDTTSLLFDQPFAGIDGGGAIVLSDSADNVIGAKSCGDELTNFDNTISGAGTIGTGGLILVNDGTINADDCNALVLDTGHTVDNAGLLEATNGGTLDVMDATICNTGSGADGIYVGGASQLLVDSASLELTGGGDVVLAGGEIADNADNPLLTGSGCILPLDLDNSNNTISGAGTIGGGELSLDNGSGGTIDANVIGGMLTLDTGDNAITNDNVIEATAGGTLDIQSDVNNSDGALNSCGVIAAIGCDALVDLDNATISGGELETSWGGLIQTVGGNSTFDDLTVARGSDVLVNDDTSLTLHGTIDNLGMITVGSGDPDLVIDGRVTLDGGGQIVLSAHGDDIVGANGSSPFEPNIFDNVSDEISGAGSIGGDHHQLRLTNGGVIDADVAHGTLTIDTGFNDVTNTGTLEASNGGKLLVDSDVDNFHGSIKADSGSTVDVAGDIHGGSATIEGGTLEFDANSNVDITFDNGTSATKTYGELVLGDRSDFSGQISKFSGTSTSDSDEIDLVGINRNDVHLQEEHGNVVVTVTEGHTIITAFTLVGVSEHDLDLTSDHHGGTLIVDPPVTSSPSSPVTIGGPGSDNFIFHPDLGVDTIASRNPQHDTIEFDSSNHSETVQELQSLLSSDAHGHSFIDVGHHDSIALPGMTADQLHASLQSAVHLH